MVHNYRTGGMNAPCLLVNRQRVQALLLVAASLLLVVQCLDVTSGTLDFVGAAPDSGSHLPQRALDTGNVKSTSYTTKVHSIARCSVLANLLLHDATWYTGVFLPWFQCGVPQHVQGEHTRVWHVAGVRLTACCMCGGSLSQSTRRARCIACAEVACKVQA
jgi:hypothetical protein